MKRAPAISALLALSTLAAFSEPGVEPAPGRRLQREPEPRFRRQKYFLDIPLRAESKRRELPPPAATPQPGPAKGQRKPSRAERKRMKARRA